MSILPSVFALLRPARLVLLVGLFGFLALGPLRGRADLTQQQMTQAMVDALKAYAAYSSGEDWAWLTVPLNEEVDMGLSNYLDIHGDPHGIAFRFETYMENFWPYIKRIGSTNQAYLVSLAGISNQLDRAYYDGYKTAVTNTLVDIKELLQREEFRDGVVTNLLALIQSKVDIPLSDMKDVLDLINVEVGSLDSLMYRLVSGDSAINEAIENVYDLLQSVSNLNSETRADLHEHYELLQEIAVDLDDSWWQLYYIRQDQNDTLQAVDGILHVLETQLDDVIVAATIQALGYGFSGDDYSTNSLIGHIFNYEQILHRIGEDVSSTQHTVTNIYTEFGGLLSSIDTNTSWTAHALTNWWPVATNFYATMTPTRDQLRVLSFETNSIVTNAAFADSEMEDETNRLMQALFGDDLKPDFEDLITENPYDAGASVFESFEDTVEQFLGDVSVASTSELVLMGSMDRRASSAIRTPLPRISFNMGEFWERYAALRTIRGVVRALWLIVGVFFRLILLTRFLDWFAKHNKE